MEAMLVEKNVSLQPYNSFGIVARAETLVRVRSLQDLVDWHHTAVRAGEAVFVLGGGSNVVLTGDVKTTVLKMELRGRRLVQETPTPGWWKWRRASPGMARWPGPCSRAGRGWRTWR